MGKPSTKVIIGIAILIATDILFAFSIHALLRTGTCSSTGYSEFGPVPRCPKGSWVFSLFLPLGTVLVIIGGWLAEASLTVPSLFCAIGAGSLAAGLPPAGGGNGTATFALIFGGCFLVAGLVWAGIALASGRRSSPTPRTPLGESVIFSGRAGFAGLIWIAVAGVAIGVGLIASGTTRATAAAVKVPVSRAPAPDRRPP